MISGWLVKIVLTVGVLGLIAFELGTPQVIKVQLDGVAAQTALEGRLQWERSGGTCQNDELRQVTEKEAARGHAKVQACSVDHDGTVRVTLYRRAKSFVAYRWKRMYTYYDVRVTKSSRRGEG